MKEKQGRVFGNGIRQGRQIKEIIWSNSVGIEDNGQIMINKKALLGENYPF